MSKQFREDDVKNVKVRNLVAKYDFNRGSGLHGKSKKAKRVADRQNLRSNLDDLLNDEYDLDYGY